MWIKNGILWLLLVSGYNAMGQYHRTTADMMNKDLVFQFGEHIILMKFSTDSTLYWRDLKNDRQAFEKSKTTHLDDHTMITAWYEEDKTFISLYADFDKMETQAMVCWDDGRFYPLVGVIDIRE